MRTATYDEIADQLTDGYWEWLGGARHSFDVAPGDTLTADITGLTPEERQLARWALEAWTNVTGIKFRFVTSGAHITFDHDVGETTALGSDGTIALQAPGRADAGQAAQQQQTSRHHRAYGFHSRGALIAHAPHASPYFCRHQITPKTSRYTRCSMSMLPNVSINRRTRSSGQLGRWWYSISPCRNNECVRRFTVFAFNQRS